jgi:hypothetical protein
VGVFPRGERWFRWPARTSSPIRCVTQIRLEDVLTVAVAAGAMSLLAAFIPVRRIAGIDPAVVFRA